jgi:hypothetical protein
MHINQTLNIVPPHLPMKTPPNYHQTPFAIKACRLVGGTFCVFICNWIKKGESRG